MLICTTSSVIFRGKREKLLRTIRQDVAIQALILHQVEEMMSGKKQNTLLAALDILEVVTHGEYQGVSLNDEYHLAAVVFPAFYRQVAKDYQVAKSDTVLTMDVSEENLIISNHPVFGLTVYTLCRNRQGWVSVSGVPIWMWVDSLLSDESSLCYHCPDCQYKTRTVYLKDTFYVCPQCHQVIDCKDNPGTSAAKQWASEVDEVGFWQLK